MRKKKVERKKGSNEGRKEGKVASEKNGRSKGGLQSPLFLFHKTVHSIPAGFQSVRSAEPVTR